MQQAHCDQEDRRRHKRVPASFTFWFRPMPLDERSAGWMLNISRGGAAFLTSWEAVPAVGDQVELTEMYSADRSVAEFARPLPRLARVIRVDDPSGDIRRVGIRFESPRSAELRVEPTNTRAAKNESPAVPDELRRQREPATDLRINA